MLKELKELEKSSNKIVLALVEQIGRDNYEGIIRKIKMLMDARIGDLGNGNDAYAKLIVASVISGINKEK